MSDSSDRHLEKNEIGYGYFKRRSGPAFALHLGGQGLAPFFDFSGELLGDLRMRSRDVGRFSRVIGQIVEFGSAPVQVEFPGFKKNGFSFHFPK